MIKREELFICDRCNQIFFIEEKNNNWDNENICNDCHEELESEFDENN